MQKRKNSHRFTNYRQNKGGPLDLIISLHRVPRPPQKNFGSVIFGINSLADFNNFWHAQFCHLHLNAVATLPCEMQTLFGR